MTNQKTFNYITDIENLLKLNEKNEIKNYMEAMQQIEKLKNELVIDLSLEVNKTSSKKRINTIYSYITKKMAKKPVLTCYTKQLENYFTFTDSFFLVSLTKADFNGLQLQDAAVAELGTYPDITKLVNNYDLSNYEEYINIKYNDLLNLFKQHKKNDTLILDNTIYENIDRWTEEKTRFQIGFNCEELKMILLCLNFKPDDDITIYYNKNKLVSIYYIFNNKTGSKGLILPVKSTLLNKENEV